MENVKFYEQALERELECAVVAARYRGRWLLCRQRDKGTWELPGGHREEGESIPAAARRELWEETGAREFQLEAVSAYSFVLNGTTSYGGLFFAELDELTLPPKEFEIGETRLFDEMPAEMTYPEIQPALMRCVQDWLDGGNFRPESEDMFEFLM